MTDTEHQYAVIKDPQNSDELLELPANVTDNSLALVTLEHAFPGAHGLKYKNPVTGANRVLLLDEAGKSFQSPSGGWVGKVFEVIFRPAALSPQNFQDEEGEKTRKRKISEFDDHTLIIENQSDALTSEVKKECEDAGQNVAEEEATKIDGGTSEDVGRASSSKKRRSNSQKQNKVADLGRRINSSCADLIVLGLPYTLESKEMRQYFESGFGRLDLCEVKKDPNGKSRGFGFIRATTYVDQIRILSQANHEIGGRICQCRLPYEDYRGRNTRASDYRNPRIFVAKLDSKFNKDKIRDFFQDHAHRFDKRCDIVDFFMPKNRAFAFISLSSPKVAHELIRQREFLIDGVMIPVTEAEPRHRDLNPPSHQLQIPQNMDPWVRDLMSKEQMGMTQGYGRPSEYIEQQRFPDSPLKQRYGEFQQQIVPPVYYDEDPRVRGDYEYGNSVAPTQYRSQQDGGFQDREGPWMDNRSRSGAGQAASAGVDFGLPPGFTPDMMRAAVKWFQQSGGPSQ